MTRSTGLISLVTGKAWRALLVYSGAALLLTALFIIFRTSCSDEMLIILMVPPIWAAQFFPKRIYLAFALVGISVSIAALVFFLKDSQSLRNSLNTCSVLSLSLVAIGEILYRSAAARRRAESQREQLIVELQTAMSNLKTLRGLLPICSYCKKIRDDQGYWNQVENYVKQHSEARFTHGICPDCVRQYFPNITEQKQLPGGLVRLKGSNTP